MSHVIKNILLTGAPGVGKTTLLRAILQGLNRPCGGFYTREVRDAQGRRAAFELVTLDGRSGLLAKQDLPDSPYRVGRYGVSLAALETLAVPEVLTAARTGQLVVIDEIGSMEFFSALFCEAVQEALDTAPAVLGTIVQRSTPHGDLIKARTDVQLIEVTRQNRDYLVGSLLAALLEKY